MRKLSDTPFSVIEENIYQIQISQPTIKEGNEMESVIAPGVLHIKALKSINFPLHPIVFA